MEAVAGKNPGSVLLVSAGVNYVQALREAGVKAPLVVLDATSSVAIERPAHALPSDLTKNIYKSSLIPPSDSVSPAPVLKRFKKDLKASGATQQSDVAPYAWTSWVGMLALAEVAKSMPNVDAASLLAALNSAKDVKLPNGYLWTPSAPGPTGYSRDSTSVGYFSKYVGNGKWKPAKPGADGILMEAKLLS